MNLKQQLKNNRHLLIAFGFIVLVATLSIDSKNQNEKQSNQQNTEIDTIIPKGYVLVPIELENQSAISSVIQSHGLIDLYLGQPGTDISKKIATKIKLIRAPYNPNMFAALVKEDFSGFLMRQSGKLYAVIQNKNNLEGQNNLQNIVKTKNIQIEYQN